MGVGINVLGPLVVTHDGDEVPITRPKLVELLCRLVAAAPDSVSVDRLSEDLWDGEPPATARKAIQVYVSQLRVLLDAPGAIRTTAGGYQLSSDVETDVRDLTQAMGEGLRALVNGDPGLASTILDGAHALWRGQAYESVADRMWALPEMARLDEIHTEILGRRNDAELAAGNHSKLVAELRDHVSEHPLKEGFWAQLILALYRSGRQAEALRTYQELRERLIEELGIEPGPQLRALEEQILTQDRALDYVAPTAAAAVEDPSPVAEAPPISERRWVTSVCVTFLDQPTDRLSTAKATELVAAIDVHGGTVTSLTGKRLTAVFGTPVTHEDDPARALRAATEIRSTMSGNTATGITCGDVVSGLVGPPTSRSFSVQGRCVEHANQLSANAEKGQIVVSSNVESHARSAGGFVRISGRGAGSIWALRSLSKPQGRPLSDSTLIGREPETALLDALWGRVESAGRAHLVTVVGEPGIGKTRLCRDWLSTIGSGHLILAGANMPYGGSSYDALASVLRQLIGGDSVDHSVTASLVDEWLAGTNLEDSTLERNAVRSILGIGLGDSIGRRELFNGLSRVIALAAAEPTIIFLEDLHWADESLLEALEWVIARNARSPILFLATARPEFRRQHPDWGRGLPAVTSLDLGDLDWETSASLARYLMDNPTDDTLAGVLDRGAGNPLYLEELASWVGAGGDDTLPSTLRGLIASRLDQLSVGGRETVRAAAAIGETVDVALLQTIADMSSTDIDELGGFGFLLESDKQDIVVFKHQLIREAAYDSIPDDIRPSLHQSIAEAIEEHPDSTMSPSDLAWHWEEADRADRAVPYLIDSARAAGATAAHHEAVRFYDRALRLMADTSSQDKGTVLLERGTEALKWLHRMLDPEDLLI